MIRGVVSGVTRADADNCVVSIDSEDGRTENVTIPNTIAKKFPLGREVTFELKPTRKPRAKNGEGAPKRKKKAE